MLLSARCFLEGLALKRMYEHGNISDMQVNLLRHQVFLIEYKHYKNFDDIADKILEISVYNLKNNVYIWQTVYINYSAFAFSALS